MNKANVITSFGVVTVSDADMDTHFSELLVLHSSELTNKEINLINIIQTYMFDGIYTMELTLEQH